MTLITQVIWVVTYGLYCVSAATTVTKRGFFDFDFGFDFGFQQFGPLDSQICLVPKQHPAMVNKTNVWADLNDNETTEIFHYLTNEFGLVHYDDATPYDNYLVWLETLRPNKTDALEYMDNDGPLPDKYARAIIYFGDQDHVSEEFPDGYWETFQVGPLPISDNTKIEPLTWQYSKTKVPYNIGYRDDHRTNMQREFFKKVFTSDVMKPVLKDLVGEMIDDYGSNNSIITAKDTSPLMIENGGRSMSWCSIFYDILGAEDILPIGIHFQIDMTGRNISDWSVHQWYYNGIAYDNSEEFRKAWESENFKKAPQIDLNNLGYINPNYNKEEPRELDEKMAPITIEPQGRRWKYNEQERYFKWMDWEFYVAWSRDVGLTLFNIKFKGERIFYELGLQEAIAEYGGDDPYQSHTAYFDRAFGFGNNAFGLIPGFDCPNNAEYFNVSWHSKGNNNHQNNSYCVFESTLDYPISRHTSKKYLSVSKNTALNIRSTTTIGNYDYMFTYEFSFDGTLTVSTRAAGYIQSAAYHAGSGDEYGFKIHDTISGSFHDHVFHFKADMDIANSPNRVSQIALKQAQRELPFRKGELWDTKIKQREVITKETDLTWPENGQGILLVESATETNAWGQPRAYRIIPGDNAVHRISKNKKRIDKSASWSHFDAVFTKQKDTEEASSNLFNMGMIDDPMVDFASYLDGESIDGEDVVFWFTLGLHHLPNTQDIPNTLFNTARASMSFTPFNYFDVEQSRDSLQQVMYTYDDEHWEFNGVGLKKTCDMPIHPLSGFDSFNYKGLKIGKGSTNYPSP